MLTDALHAFNDAVLWKELVEGHAVSQPIDLAGVCRGASPRQFASCQSRTQEATCTNRMHQLCRAMTPAVTLVDGCRAIREGRVSPVELVTEAIRSLQDWQPVANATSQLFASEALRAAETLPARPIGADHTTPSLRLSQGTHSAAPLLIRAVACSASTGMLLVAKTATAWARPPGATRGR